MWGAIASLAVSVLSSLFSNSQAAAAEEEAESYLDTSENRIKKQQKENEAWYNRRYNEDYTQRADAQRALTLAEENIKERNRGAAGKQAVQGGTEESVAATKAANAQTLADATSQIAAKGAEQKDLIDKEYRDRAAELNDQLINLDTQRFNVKQNQAKNIVSAGSNANQSMGNIMNAVSLLGGGTSDLGTRATGGDSTATGATTVGSDAAAGGTRATGAEGSSILSQNITPTPPNPYDVNTPTSIFDEAAQASGNNLNKVNADPLQVDWYNIFRA